MPLRSPISESRPAVLLVEDDVLIAELAAGALEGAGFEVTSVTAAEDGLGLAVMDVPFDALVTDINLAGALDGWELAEALREMQPGLPVVYASGGAEDGDPRAVPDAAFVPKPYNPVALCEAVTRVIGARPVRQRQRHVPEPARERPRPALRLIA